MTFADLDSDSKLRASQLGSPEKIVKNSLNGSFSFTPTLTARLPIVGELSWGGSWNASLSNGVLAIGSPTLNPTSTATVQQLLENGYILIPVRNHAGLPLAKRILSKGRS